MGFGTLFIGYFLLFNIPYFGMTDIIASTVMMLGLSKLASVNSYFRSAYITSVIFAVYSLPELVLFSLDLFDIVNTGDLTSYIRVGQCVIVCILTVLILKGIYEVSREVELERVPGRAKFMIYSSFVVYTLWILASEPHVTALLGTYAFILYVIAIIALFLLIGVNLVIIYTCYMKICMPGDENGSRRETSRFGFINRQRERAKERERENLEYRKRRLEEKLRGRKKK